MRAGLSPFGEDLGNGHLDGQLFHVDDEAALYRERKDAVPADRHVVRSTNDVHDAVHRAGLALVADRLRTEHGLHGSFDDDTQPLAHRWHQAAMSVQEDLALLHRGHDDVGDTLMLHVCFPSGWRPERLLGASFAEIHRPVPDFPQFKGPGGDEVDPRSRKAAQSMVRAMVDRGPYTRFVWTVSADDHLDHHPEQGRRAAWGNDGVTVDGWFRCERQITWPLAGVDGALFVIRTYLTPFGALSAEERRVLQEAVAVMPDEIAAYKGMLAGRAEILRRLAAHH